MGTRFRKRIRLGKFLYWNFHWSGKNGITNSVSLGQPGANINIGKKDGGIGFKRGTIGLPGTGLRHDFSTTSLSRSTQSATEPSSETNLYEDMVVAEHGLAVKVIVGGVLLAYMLVFLEMF